MTNPPPVKEIIPKSGLLFQEITLQPVLCKPKIMPLKSVTLEKLEKMQKQAQDKALELEKKQDPGLGRPKTAIAPVGTDVNDANAPVARPKTAKADVWRADDEQQVPEADED